MAFIIPKKIEKLTHGGIVKALLEENKDYTIPNRTNWAKHVPDLVHRTEKITVEVELTDLSKAWGQCLSYYRLGSEEIHLLLTPKLFAQYELDESRYVVRNPIPNIVLHKLPIVKKRRGRPYTKKTVEREITISPPEERFYEPSDSKKQLSSLDPWKDTGKAPFFKTSRQWQRTRKPTPPKLKTLSKKSSRQRKPKSTQRYKPNSAEPCEYCHIFTNNSSSLTHSLCCGRAIYASPDDPVNISNDVNVNETPKRHRWNHNKETGLSTCKHCGFKVKTYRVKRGGIALCNTELMKRFCDHKWGKWFIPFVNAKKEMRLCQICKLTEEIPLDIQGVRK